MPYGTLNLVEAALGERLSDRQVRNWRIAARILFAAWVGCAVLVMNRVRGGLVTNYGADVTQPAWLYIVTRDLGHTGSRSCLKRAIGARDEITALTIFGAGTLTEVSRWHWPAGMFGGRFDPFDIAAFAVGIGLCYLLDKYVAHSRGYRERAAPPHQPVHTL